MTNDEPSRLQLSSTYSSSLMVHQTLWNWLSLLKPKSFLRTILRANGVFFDSSAEMRWACILTFLVVSFYVVSLTVSIFCSFKVLLTKLTWRPGRIRSWLTWTPEGNQWKWRRHAKRSSATSNAGSYNLRQCEITKNNKRHKRFGLILKENTNFILRDVFDPNSFLSR